MYYSWCVSLRTPLYMLNFRCLCPSWFCLVFALCNCEKRNNESQVYIQQHIATVIDESLTCCNFRLASQWEHCCIIYWSQHYCFLKFKSHSTYTSNVEVYNCSFNILWPITISSKWLSRLFPSHVVNRNQKMNRIYTG